MPSMLKIDSFKIRLIVAHGRPLPGYAKRVTGLDDILDDFAPRLWGKSSPKRSSLHMQCRVGYGECAWSGNQARCPPSSCFSVCVPKKIGMWKDTYWGCIDPDLRVNKSAVGLQNSKVREYVFLQLRYASPTCQILKEKKCPSLNGLFSGNFLVVWNLCFTINVDDLPVMIE